MSDSEFRLLFASRKAISSKSNTIHILFMIFSTISIIISSLIFYDAGFDITGKMKIYVISFCVFIALMCIIHIFCIVTNTTILFKVLLILSILITISNIIIFRNIYIEENKLAEEIYGEIDVSNFSKLLTGIQKHLESTDSRMPRAQEIVENMNSRIWYNAFFQFPSSYGFGYEMALYMFIVLLYYCIYDVIHFNTFNNNNSLEQKTSIL